MRPKEPKTFANLTLLSLIVLSYSKHIQLINITPLSLPRTVMVILMWRDFVHQLLIFGGVMLSPEFLTLAFVFFFT